MEASEIYKCIADPQRLRILNLLEAGPLCVCHMQEILEVPQVKMSKQLLLKLLTQTRVMHGLRLKEINIHLLKFQLLLFRR